MAGWSIRARAPRGETRSLPIQRDPDVLASFREDAAHFPGGHALGLVAASSEADIAQALKGAACVLPIGAQSSLTGGATPHGELIISTGSLNRILDIRTDTVRVEAGVTLAALDSALTQHGGWYAPAPTFPGAFVGGTIATNAAGAATFKYGTTRRWVRALTIVLPTGDVLDVDRGATRAHADGYFEIVLRQRTISVAVPTYRMPKVPKVSAGYFSASDMDLIDLFIGAEGTLGVITEATLEILPSRPATCLAFVPFRQRAVALAFVNEMRQAAHEAWRTKHSCGLDVSAIEHMDQRCLQLLREDKVDRATGITWPDDAAIALLITLELPGDTRPEGAFAEIGRAREPDAPDTPIVRFCRALDRAHVLDDVEIAVPGDRRRAAQLHLLREAVPAAVNQRVGRAKETVDPRIEKTAADVIVPFDKFGELLALYDEEFDRRGLDRAVWGHVSDGNLHPNVIPRSFADVQSGREAIVAFGREAIRLGGSPLAEHGVGRNPTKQRLLRELYGEDGIEEMRRIKRALDPEWKLAPGVLFSEKRGEADEGETDHQQPRRDRAADA
jgi:D-lactate dehydrogenase (cytochrome)